MLKNVVNFEDSHWEEVRVFIQFEALSLIWSTISAVSPLL